MGGDILEEEKKEKYRQYMKDYMKRYRKDNPNHTTEVARRYWKKRLEQELTQENKKEE